MILESLNNTEKVERLHPLFKKAFDYIKATDFSKIEDGKYELDGTRLFVNVVTLFGKDKKRLPSKHIKVYRYTASFIRSRKDRMETRLRIAGSFYTL